MRADALGLFWRDEPVIKREKIEKTKRIPPEPVWLKPDYLPGLDEAIAFDVHVMSDQEMIMAANRRERLVFDIECYINYYIASFRSLVTGHVLYFEMTPEKQLDVKRLEWVLQNFTTVGFNSLGYDLPITYLALSGKPNSLLKYATNQIILEGWRGSDVLKQYRTKAVKHVDHIDLIEVAPLSASLKIYGGRLHTPRMQDLPFHPDVELTPEQIAIVRWYNVNSDLTATAFLHETLKEHIDLRYTMSNEIKTDLRSKSDAQVAEAVIGTEIFQRTGVRPERPFIEIGTAYNYRIPHFIQFKSELLNMALNVISRSYFIVDESGSIAMPDEIKSLKLDINGTIYQMGIGGLHSCEKSVCHVSDEMYILKDKDVTSFYPFIILNLGLYPHHLGPIFLQVYKSIVDRRIAAKKAGDKVTADSLKITINGSYGKLGSKYSILYSPDLLIQVTLTGQLSLLMLIERMEYAGIHVVSANTDGIVIKCPRDKQHIMDGVIKQWEKDTGFETEETVYKALYSRDVNNYIAVKEDGGTKCKGAYANPWSNKKNLAERLHKNPTSVICVEAVEALLTNGVPVTTTIRNCTDIRKFVSVRNVKGGAVKVWDRLPPPQHSTKEELLELAGYTKYFDNRWYPKEESSDNRLSLDAAYKTVVDVLSPPGRTEYLGKAIRWYYAKGVEGEIVYAKNGNKVPRSEGAKPLMDLPTEFPEDINYDWYIEEANKILVEIGYGSTFVK